MRYLLLAALLGLSACGGGGSSTQSPSPTPPPNEHVPVSHTFDEFFPLFTHSGSAVVTDHSGNVYSSYTFVPNQPHWGDNWEVWDIVDCVVQGHSEQWAVVLGFKTPTGPLWEAVDTKTTWNGVEVRCDKGTPYAPIVLPQSGVYTIKQYGRIADSKDFYWEAEYTFGTSVYNPCWQGADATRPAVIQREVWMDRGNPVAVRGTIVGDPWLTVPQVHYSTWNAAGLNAGFLWVYRTDTGEYCLRSLTVT